MANIKRSPPRGPCSPGFPSIGEPEGLFRADGKCPDGQTLIPFEQGRSMVWDFTATDTLAATYLEQICKQAGKAAEQAETRKRNKQRARDRSRPQSPVHSPSSRTSQQISDARCRSSSTVVNDKHRDSDLAQSPTSKHEGSAAASWEHSSARISCERDEAPESCLLLHVHSELAEEEDPVPRSNLGRRKLKHAKKSSYVWSRRKPARVASCPVLQTSLDCSICKLLWLPYKFTSAPDLLASVPELMPPVTPTDGGDLPNECDVIHETSSLGHSKSSSLAEPDFGTLRPLRKRHLSLKDLYSESSVLIRTPTEFLTPEILDDPVALARHGFYYPPGYGPPYPPLPFGCGSKCKVSQSDSGGELDLEIHELSESNPVSPRSSRTSECETDSCPCCSEGFCESQESYPAEEAERNVDEILLAEPVQAEENDAELWWRVDLCPARPKCIRNFSSLLPEGADRNSVCGEQESAALAVRMVLHALEIPCSSSFPPFRDRKTVVRHTVVDFIKDQMAAGRSPDDLVSEVAAASERRVAGRFFRCHPRPSLSLDKWLAFWLLKGFVPVLCMNVAGACTLCSQVSEGLPESCGWSYRLVVEVKGDNIRVEPPMNVYRSSDFWKRLDCEPTKMTHLRHVLEEASGRSDYGDLSDLKDSGGKLNVSGQTAWLWKMWRSSRGSDVPLPDPFGDLPRRTRNLLEDRQLALTLPSRMEGGIVLFTRTENDTLCKLLKDMKEPLADPKF